MIMWHLIKFFVCPRKSLTAMENSANLFSNLTWLIKATEIGEICVALWEFYELHMQLNGLPVGAVFVFVGAAVEADDFIAQISVEVKFESVISAGFNFTVQRDPELL